MKILARFARFAAVAVVSLAATGPAWACPVCYGAADNSMIDGAKASVLFLGAFVYCLLGAAVALVFALRRHARKLADQRLDPHGGLKLVPPTEGVAR